MRIMEQDGEIREANIDSNITFLHKIIYDKINKEEKIDVTPPMISEEEQKVSVGIIIDNDFYTIEISKKV